MWSFPGLARCELCNIDYFQLLFPWGILLCVYSALGTSVRQTRKCVLYINEIEKKLEEEDRIFCKK